MKKIKNIFPKITQKNYASADGIQNNASDKPTVSRRRPSNSTEKEYFCKLIGKCEIDSLQPTYCYKLATWYARTNSDKTNQKIAVKLDSHHLQLMFTSSFMTSLRDYYQRIFQKRRDKQQQQQEEVEGEPTTIFDPGFTCSYSHLQPVTNPRQPRHSWHSLSESFDPSSADERITMRDIAYCGILRENPRVLFITSRDQFNMSLAIHVISFPCPEKAESFRREIGQFFAANHSVVKGKVRQSFSVPVSNGMSVTSSVGLMPPGRSMETTSLNYVNLQLMNAIESNPRVRNLRKQRLHAISSNPM